MSKRPPPDNVDQHRKRRRVSSSSSSSDDESDTSIIDDNELFNVDDFITAIEYRLNTRLNDNEKTFLKLANKRVRSSVSVDLNNFRAFGKKEQKHIIDTLNKVKETNESDQSYLLKVLRSGASIETKSHIIRKIEQSDSSHDSAKLTQYIENSLKIPLGQLSKCPINSSATKVAMKKYINESKEILDNHVYGQELAKNKFLQVIAQSISNPNANCSVIGLVGTAGTGKCFSKDTLILMYDGSMRKVQEVEVGEKVMGDDSTPRNVLSLGEGQDEMYKITPTKGDSYTVNSEHILCLKWSGKPRVYRRKERENNWYINYFDAKEIKRCTKKLSSEEEGRELLERINYTPYVNIEVNKYLKLGKDIQNQLKGYSVGVEFEEKEVFDPYLIGLWLGDGSSNGPEITNQESTVIRYLYQTLPQYDLMLNYKGDYNPYCYRIKSCYTSRKGCNKFKNILAEHNLLDNKHIPDIYKINGRVNQLKLLAGLLDSDGYLDDNCYEITQKNKKLADDIVYLCRSLGFLTTIRSTQKGCMYKGEKRVETYYKVFISGNALDEIPTLVPRKKAHIRNQVKDPLVTGIKVESAGRDNYYGFTLDGNHKFLLGSFTVTHNTLMVQEGVSRVLKRPFVYIPLGGCGDISYLQGFSYCWEGSHHGKILDSLMKAKVMDPVFYFDELDKISEGWRGWEVVNALIQLIDVEQNKKYEDRYFSGIDLDISRATFIFSYNDRSKVNYILRDRITEIKIDGYKNPEKLTIAQKYILPKIYKDVGIKEGEIVFENGLLEYIIDNYTNEGGVRKFKEKLYEVIREINLRVISGKHNYKFPLIITKKMVKNDLLLKFQIVTPELVHAAPTVGKINGLFTTCADTGGILPIEVSERPTSKKFECQITGMLGKNMEESVNVAKTVAWNLLPSELKVRLNKKWEKEGVIGFHVHFPNATSKDGPSAGVAITMAILSHLVGIPINNKVGITGEVTLTGDVGEIGGLRNKLYGAKKAGVTRVLYPQDNHKDIRRIKEELPELFDATFTARPISRVEEAIDECFGKHEYSFAIKK